MDGPVDGPVDGPMDGPVDGPMDAPVAGAMLVELHVRDLGVIDDVTVRLGPGTTALTGETGAGKTLLVEALGLLLGGRADPSVVRTGAAEALVEARFARPGADGDQEVLLARSVVREGRSRAWIDGRMATVGALAEAAHDLIELHGQHQHRTLVHPAAQRRALDAFGAIDTTRMEEARRRMAALVRESEALGGDARQRAREVEMLRYQIEEIERADIEDADEDARLEVEEDRLADAAAHRHAAAAALVALTGDSFDADGLAGGAPGGDGGPQASGAIDRLAEAAGALAGRGPLARFDGAVRSQMIELGELASELRSVVETWEDDPARLGEVRARRELLRQLGRKYGPTPGEVLAFAQGALAQLAVLAGEEERAAAIDLEIETARHDVEESEEGVAAARRRVAPLLAAQIEATLRELAMPSACFAVRVDGPGSAEQVSFELAANPGESALPLARVASGGELSRTMLALRLALTDAPGVLVFDEVDAGVGGTAAVAVGSALAGLGRHAQVIVVTHLAQVAARADGQIAVAKREEGGRTRSEVVPLDGEARVVELSRMLSGSPDSESARRHARELLGTTGEPGAGDPERPGSARRRDRVR